MGPFLQLLEVVSYMHDMTIAERYVVYANGNKHSNMHKKRCGQ
jgi:hypothetical protein